jgi:hypothetical protein
MATVFAIYEIYGKFPGINAGQIFEIKKKLPEKREKREKTRLPRSSLS